MKDNGHGMKEFLSTAKRPDQPTWELTDVNHSPGANYGSEKFIALENPSNAGGGKRPYFRIRVRKEAGKEIGQPNNSNKSSENPASAICKS
ncbi:MAG: hypothetical protein LBP22_08180 [Deltaproteobacteria bacterium]|jgi:hypothetical protein|nr:hypothetical protein [Deltaproteobacteria bacterium]